MGGGVLGHRLLGAELVLVPVGGDLRLGGRGRGRASGPVRDAALRGTRRAGRLARSRRGVCCLRGPVVDGANGHSGLRDSASASVQRDKLVKKPSQDTRLQARMPPPAR
ncbi:hypothetical protein D187_009546 [Cystobacter fuscus DSM 2262]|uniref:Uncharacterized protein n=1 Tax=Cystobacter fuscus (strain ATCC 25194 / DSM 2262 / NBRC 100088 / M29) TaxID=1242864 RepID=S9NSF3_CYSF2|nr:hypothetical protein D187_009546 [Cystobacter fuscus DSM 2262]